MKFIAILKVILHMVYIDFVTLLHSRKSNLSNVANFFFSDYFIYDRTGQDSHVKYHF